MADAAAQALAVDRARYVILQAVVCCALAKAIDAYVVYGEVKSVVAWVSIWLVVIKANALGLLTYAWQCALIQGRTLDLLDQALVMGTQPILVALGPLRNVIAAFQRGILTGVVPAGLVPIQRLRSCKERRAISCIRPKCSPLHAEITLCVVAATNHACIALRIAVLSSAICSIEITANRAPVVQELREGFAAVLFFDRWII